MDEKPLPLSDPGPMSGELLKDHQRQALSKMLFMEHDLAALEESRRRHDNDISNYDLLDLSAFDHCYTQESPSVWKHVITGDEVISRTRPTQGKGMILADEMGVGKTAPSISLIEATAQHARAWAQGQGDLDDAETNPEYLLPDGRSLDDFYIDEAPPDLPAYKKRRLMAADQDACGNRKLPKTSARRRRRAASDSDASDDSNEDGDDDDENEHEDDRDLFRTHATLIVCPKSVLAIWKESIDQHWAGPVVEGFRRSRGRQRTSDTLMLLDHWETKKSGNVTRYQNVDIILTTYDALVGEWKKDGPLYDMIFYRVIYDEGHRFCNMETQAFKAANNLYCRHLLILTGTPIQNTINDLRAYSVLLRVPGGLDDMDNFHKFFVDPIRNLPEHTKPNWKALQQFAKIFTLRRLKTDLKDERLPPKVIKAFYLDPTSDQKRIHDDLIGTGHTWAVMAHQRRIAANLDERDWLQDLMHRREAWKNDQYVDDDDEHWVSSKCEWLKYFAQQTEGKIVIFSQWTRMLDRVEAVMRSLKYKVLRLQGDVEAEDRPKIAGEFNHSRSQKMCLLATIGCAGEGISLIGARVCIFTDLCWNPSKHNQAMDRLHRIGQTEEVSVYLPVTKDTIEEDVWVCQQAKRAIYHHIWPNDPPGELDMVLTHEVLFEFLRRAPVRANHNDDDDEDED